MIVFLFHILYDVYTRWGCQMNQYICTLDEIIRRKKMSVKVGIHKVLIAYHQGDVYAIKDKCPHMGFPLSLGKYENGHISCKEHGLSIGVVDGLVEDEAKADALHMDAYSRSVKTYKTSIIDNKVYIIS